MALIYPVAAVGLAMVPVFAYGALVGAAGTGKFAYSTALSDALFFEGAAAFTSGAFVEFFARAWSPAVGRALAFPLEALLGRQAGDGGADTPRGGWLLIAIGTLVLVASAVFVSMPA